MKFIFHVCPYAGVQGRGVVVDVVLLATILEMHSRSSVGTACKSLIKPVTELHPVQAFCVLSYSIFIRCADMPKGIHCKAAIAGLANCQIQG